MSNLKKFLSSGSNYKLLLYILSITVFLQGPGEISLINLANRAWILCNQILLHGYSGIFLRIFVKDKLLIESILLIFHTNYFKIWHYI